MSNIEFVLILCLGLIAVVTSIHTTVAIDEKSWLPLSNNKMITISALLMIVFAVIVVYQSIGVISA